MGAEQRNTLFRLCSARTRKTSETADNRWNTKSQLTSGAGGLPQVREMLGSEPGL